MPSGSAILGEQRSGGVAALMVAVGDEVELWGQNVPIQEVAANADTIDYELMTRVSQRVPRIVKYL